ncbi:hypothetical protein Hanom_Chr04g00366561 [Helianthus anomalus]
MGKITCNSGANATLAFRSFQTPYKQLWLQICTKVAPSLTLDLKNGGTTCNSGTIVTPSHLPPPFQSVCYGTIANPTHLSHSRSEQELIDTKPNWVKGDTLGNHGGEVEVRGYVVVGGRERDI